MFKKELQIFLTAIMFFTRIPVPKTLPYSTEYLNKSMRYFTIVGIIIGSVALGVFYGFNQIISEPVAIFFSMLATIYVTGAFHEDGFADFCDGFGGGTTKAKILEIMKDSRIGTYGSIGLIGVLGSKFLLLSQLHSYDLLFALIAGHICSRILPVYIIHNLKYVQENDVSKSKPLGKRSSIIAPMLSTIIGFGCLFNNFEFIIYLLPSFVVLYVIYTKYIERKVGGYTGDILGALQQISEICFYLMFVIYLNTWH